MKKITKNIVHDIIIFSLGAIIFGSVGVAVAENIQSSTVDYNKNSQATVEDALDDLYERSTTCPEKIDLTNNPTLVNYVRTQYQGDDASGATIFYHDKEGTYGTYEAGDLSYRYSGASSNVNNYICFASDDTTCPNENLYRIIGVFKNNEDKYQAKIIKATPATSVMLGTDGDYKLGDTYYWNNNTKKGNWSESQLNTINLNTNYINYLFKINSKWSNMIETHTWIVGGNTSANISSTSGAQNVYYYEIVNPAISSTYDDKIGLIYSSDYMYGASPNHWYKMGYYYNSSSSDYRSAKTSNWLSTDYTEWSITRFGDTYVCEIFGDGHFEWSSSSNVYSVDRRVRPTFYLDATVKYAKGTGTSSDPIRIG